MTSRHFLISLRMSSTILHVLHENQPPRYRNKYFASTFALYVLQFNFGMCIKKVTTYLIYIIKRKVCIRINSFYMIINVDLQQISAYIYDHIVLFYFIYSLWPQVHNKLKECKINAYKLVNSILK